MIVAVALMKIPVVAHLLAPSGPIPNHPRWPLLVYPQAVPNPTPEAFEALFTRNGWPAAWRNGVFPFHHYHSNAHEALGVYAGEVTVKFGGEGGVEVQARPGDVIVLPAGTGHKKVSSRGAFGIVGAYPQGAKPDTCMPPFARKAKNAQSVLQVGLPRADPVLGASGPLFEHWR
jgi:uncharacterized protein YjlB